MLKGPALRSRPTGREEQSQFEEAVARALESLGYQLHRQVGIAGFFVDLTVVDPKRVATAHKSLL
jgi:hypothetical protein